MIVVGLALFSTLSTHSVAESETQPHFVVIKTLLKVFDNKTVTGFSDPLSTFKFLLSVINYCHKALCL